MSPNLLARYAGLNYLILIVAGLFGMVYVPAVVFDWSSPAGTATTLAANEGLFRWGIIGCLVSYLAFLVATTLLHRLFSAAFPLAALFLLGFGWIGAVAFMANALSYVGILELIPAADAGAQPLEAAGQAILQAAANFNTGFKLMQAVTGLWLVMLGILVFRSALLPRVIGVFLVVSGSLNYIGEFVVAFVGGAAGFPWFMTLPGTLAEFSTCLWLLTAGAAWQTRQQKRCHTGTSAAQGQPVSL